MLTPFIIAAAVAFVLSLVLTPAVMRLAPLVGAIDTPNARKVHRHPVPRLGGVAIFASFIIGLFSLDIMMPQVLEGAWIFQSEGIVLMAMLFLVMCLGIWDDINPLKPGQKFLVQLLLGSVIYWAGFSVSNVTNVFGSGTTALGVLDFPLTLLWIVGVTNALNLIDGLDGLAAGVATIASMTILPIALLHGDNGTAVLALLAAASLVGFLRYNFNPAKIFLGDSGSLFLGFLLAILSLKSSTKSSTGFALLVPILALGLPIMDTLLSMIRRFLRSFMAGRTNPETMVHRLRSMFQPDSSHIHHRLINRGLSHRNAVILLYVVSCFLGVGAFSITVFNDYIGSLVLVVVAAATVIGVRQLRYREMQVLQNGVLLPLYDKPILRVESFQVFFDIAVIIASFTFALLLTSSVDLGISSTRYLLGMVTAVAATQLMVFWMTGMYRRTFRIYGIGDVLRTMRGVLAAVAAVAVIFFVFAQPFTHVQLTALIIDFFFLGLFVVGFRISFHVLQFLSSFRGAENGTKVVIYGADPNGIMLLNRILEAGVETWNPIGFLDDNPELEGKYINGYPVFGSHWQLPKLFREHAIDQVVICSENIKPEALRRIHDFTRRNDISLKRIRILFEDYHEQRDAKPVPLFTHAAAETSANEITVPADVYEPRLEPVMNRAGGPAGLASPVHGVVPVRS